VTNAVALCPNCHRHMHYGKDRKQIQATVFANVAELIPE
jgi:5-methylcytosine-specific restriction protein A